MLDRHIPLWPPIDEILATSKKMCMIRLLDKIAANITHTARPITNPICLPLESVPQCVVLKREVSDNAAHVFLPAEIGRMTLKSLNLKLNRMGNGFQWFSQTYVPFVRQFGEWRVYFVGGSVFHILVTLPVGYKHRVEAAGSGKHWTLEELT
jgi:hypothetical protein